MHVSNSHFSTHSHVVDTVSFILKRDWTLTESDDARRDGQSEVVDVVWHEELVVRKMLLRAEALLARVRKNQFHALSAIPKS